MPISDEPPLFAVSIRIGSKTNQLLEKSKYFSVNWIDFADRRLISLLSESVDSDDKLKTFEVPYKLIFQTPVLIRAQAYAICEIQLIQETGDHNLIIGKVIGAMASLDFDQHWKFLDYSPILYLGSNFRNPFAKVQAKPRSRNESVT